METCSICKKAIEGANPDRIPIGAGEKPICSACKAQLNLLLHSSRLTELRGAIRYLTVHAETTADSDVAMALRTLCEKNAARLPGAADALAAPLRESNDQSEPPSIWISIVKAAGWSLLVLMILGGLFGAFAIWGSDIDGSGLLGFFTLVASFFLGLFSVAGIMVFANQAEDTREIRNLLSQSLKKEK